MVAQECKWGPTPGLRGEALTEDSGGMGSVDQRRRQVLRSGAVVPRGGQVALENEKPLSASTLQVPLPFSLPLAPFLPADTCAVDRGHSPSLLPV